MGSSNSNSVMLINANEIALAISILQVPTYIKPKEIAVNAITSRPDLESLSIGVNWLRIW